MTRRALLLVALLSVLPERLFISYLAPAVAVAAATLLVLWPLLSFLWVLARHIRRRHELHPSRRTPN